MNKNLFNFFPSEVIAGYTADLGGKWNYNDPESAENFALLGADFGISAERMLRLHQKHTAEIRTITASDGGEGVIRPGTEAPFDGMITNEPMLMPCIITADCVPVFLYDSRKHVIGLVHSGRVGTWKEAAAAAVLQMQRDFGTNPADVSALFGPYLSQRHHQLQLKDIEPFNEHFSESERATFIAGTGLYYYADMGRAIRISLERVGVKAGNISDCGICTYERPDLFSFRRDRDSSRHLLSFIMLRA